MARKSNKGKAPMKQHIATESAPTTGRVKIRCHSNTNSIEDITKQLEGQYLEMFENSCFGHLKKMPNIELFVNVVHNVLLRRKYVPKKGREKVDSMSFIIGVDQEICFSELEFALLSGLKFQGTEMIDHHPNGIRLMKVYFPDKTGVKLDELIKKFHELPQSLDKLKLGLLYIAEGVLLGSLSNSIVDKGLFHLVDNLEEYNKYPWGKLSYRATVKSLISVSEKASLDQTQISQAKSINRIVHYRLYGFPQVFQAWIFHRMPVFKEMYTDKNEDFPQAFNPRILHLKRTMSKAPTSRKNKIDLSNVNIKVSPPLHPTTEELKQGYMAGFSNYGEEISYENSGIPERNGEDISTQQWEANNYSNPTNSLQDDSAVKDKGQSSEGEVSGSKGDQNDSVIKDLHDAAKQREDYHYSGPMNSLDASAVRDKGLSSDEECSGAKGHQDEAGIKDLNDEDDTEQLEEIHFSISTNSLEVDKQNGTATNEAVTLSGGEDQDADSPEKLKLKLRSEIENLKKEREDLNNKMMEENVTFNKRKALLESEIQSLRNEKTTLQSDVEFLNKEKSAVQGDICALNERKTDLENEAELLNNKLRSEAEFLHKEKSTVQGDIRSLNETKSFLESEIKSLSNVKTKLQTETEFLNQDKTKLGMDVVLLNKGKCQVEIDLKILQDEKNKLHSDIESLNKEMAKLATNLEFTNKEKDKLQGDAKLLKEEKDKLQSDVEFLNEEKAKLGAHTELLSKEKTNLQSDFECLNKEKSTVQGDICSLNQKKTMLQDDICSLNGKKITVQDDICSLNENKTTVHGNMRWLNEKKTILENEVKSLSIEKANLGNETELLNKEKTKLQSDVCSLNEKKDILESDIESLSNEKTNLGNETEYLNKEKTKLQSDVELLNQEKSTVQGDICNLKEKKTTVENDIRWLNEKKNMVQDDFRSLNGKKTILESEIESVNNVKTNLGIETDLLNKEKTKLLSEFEFLKQEKTKFATDVGLLKERKSELETEIEVSQDEKNELDNDIKLLTQEKDKLQEFLIEPEAEFIHSETSDVNDIGLTLKRSQRGRGLLRPVKWWENEQAVYDQDGGIIGIQKGSSIPEHPRGMNVLVKKGKRVLDSNFDNNDIGSSSKEKANQLGAKEFITDLEKQLDNERRKRKLNDQLLKEMTTRMEEQKQELSALVSHLAAKGLRSSKIPRPSRTSNQLTSSGQESSQQSKHESQTSKPILIECRLANVDRSNVIALGTIFYSWTKNQTVDGAELENDCYKVSIDVAIKENAVLPFPDDDGKHRTVEKALGRFVAWPKDLVIPVSEIPEPTQVHPKEKQNTKKRKKTTSDSDT